MKKFLLLNLLITIFTAAFTQNYNDTIYFDLDWKESTKTDYSYYRIITKDQSGLDRHNDYWKDGELQMTGTFTQSDPPLQNGVFTWYFKNGNIKLEKIFKNDSISGLTRKYKSDGELDLEYNANIDSLDNAKIFKKIVKQYVRYIAANTIYPKKAINNRITGKVFVLFYVDTNGKVIRPTIIEGVCTELDEEAIRVVSAFKKWPAPKYKGKAVTIEFIAPINFQF